jgi:hypothetical protein
MAVTGNAEQLKILNKNLYSYRDCVGTDFLTIKTMEENTREKTETWNCTEVTALLF